MFICRSIIFPSAIYISNSNALLLRKNISLVPFCVCLTACAVSQIIHIVNTSFYRLWPPPPSPGHRCCKCSTWNRNVAIIWLQPAKGRDFCICVADTSALFVHRIYHLGVYTLLWNSVWMLWCTVGTMMVVVGLVGTYLSLHFKTQKYISSSVKQPNTLRLSLPQSNVHFMRMRRRRSVCSNVI